MLQRDDQQQRELHPIRLGVDCGLGDPAGLNSRMPPFANTLTVMMSQIAVPAYRRPFNNPAAWATTRLRISLPLLMLSIKDLSVSNIQYHSQVVKGSCLTSTLLRRPTDAPPSRLWYAHT